MIWRIGKRKMPPHTLTENNYRIRYLQTLNNYHPPDLLGSSNCYLHISQLKYLSNSLSAKSPQSFSKMAHREWKLSLTNITIKITNEFFDY